jgi:hypothetical protein
MLRRAPGGVTPPGRPNLQDGRLGDKETQTSRKWPVLATETNGETPLASSTPTWRVVGRAPFGEFGATGEHTDTGEEREQTR